MSPSHYTEAFTRFAYRLHPFEQMQRRSLLESFLASGFPTRDQEDWRYTDLSSYDARRFFLGDFDPQANLGAELLAGTERLVYVNGEASTALSTGKRWHTNATARVTADDGILALNAAFSTGGLSLKLDEGERLTRPLQVLFHGRADGVETMTHQRHRIELGPDTEATVLLQFCGTGSERLGTHVVDIRLAPGARLRLYRLNTEGSGATLVTQINARLSRNSRLDALTVDLGDGLARHGFDVDLAEAGAEAEVSGLYAPPVGAHIDNHIRVVHAAPHCRSRSHYRGIIEERAKAVFNGKVVVNPGAQKTDSEQRIANLLLSRKAEVNAKPELEIYADDVKCAHGATVGQLDATALAYLRSRGIPRDVARSLLLRAFATEILDRIEWPELRERVERSLHLPAAMVEVIEA